MIAVGRVGSWEGGVFIKHRIVLPPCHVQREL